MADTFVKNPVLLVGEKDKVVAQMGENDLGVATDVEFYTKKQIDELLENSGGASLPILMQIWADHILNDMSWLRADDFSWHSGDVYVAAYEHLVTDFQDATADTETIADITIAFYRAEDGHKICLPDQESNISALYESTGVAWYYLLDTENKQFKLPRTKWGFTGLRDSVGNYIAESLPNIKGEILNVAHGKSVSASASGAFKRSVGNDTGNAQSGGQTNNFYLDASTYSETYQDNAPVQQRATQMYLYFYVGNFEQSAVEQTAGLNTELFNGKADIDLNNINPSNSAKAMIVGWGMPDYTAGVALSDITPSNPYTATIDCVIYGTAYNGAVYVNGNIVAYADGTNYAFPITIILPKGDIITTTATKMGRVYMIPLKGVN